MGNIPDEALQVLDFWFRELVPEQWFRGGAALDELVTKRFGGLLERAGRGELAHWKESVRGRLALIILLDQFSRHVHRGAPEAFASDPLAQLLCLEAIELGQDKMLNMAERHFLYMPLMHAESLELQERSIEAFASLHEFTEGVLQFADAHREQIRRFSRFPYRNAALGRPFTPEEQAFVASGEGEF